MDHPVYTVLEACSVSGQVQYTFSSMVEAETQTPTEEGVSH